MKNIEILYEDDSALIINKPAGLAVQGGEGVKSSLDVILSKMRSPAPLLVHRLDKDTSGIVLAAKNRDAAAHFSHVFRNHQKVKKIYIAVCRGIPGKKQGGINDDLYIRGKQKKSQTMYRVLKSGKLPLQDRENYSVLELVPETGRMHQIRRHLAMRGNPVLGDDKYGDFALNKKLRKSMGLKNLLLHASGLIINDGCQIEINAPAPDYFSGYLPAD
ncbi:MAG: RluA family pseudouridine synthase [Treponema sp.]|jgi:23S rRNA pseudouridine955/2504/2580 synthase|nr:RluA family pseudouridine synthase [Treponema sp.]